MSRSFELSVAQRLLRHEATVHAVPGRHLTDLGDCLLLHDAAEAEPFWNRLEAIRFPVDTEGFDRRLTEVALLFARLGRQPHIWTLPPYDSPGDLVARLRANGFEDAGPGCLMAAADARAARTVLAETPGPGLFVERFGGLVGPRADVAARAIVGVLLEAFQVEEERRAGVLAETLASIADPRFTHYLVRLDGTPVAAARRATFDGLSYLSSIGTVAAARGRGLGRLVTATSMVDGFAAGSEFVHLGVFFDNTPARVMYERLGFAYVGEPGPDMILV